MQQACDTIEDFVLTCSKTAEDAAQKVVRLGPVNGFTSIVKGGTVRNSRIPLNRRVYHSKPDSESESDPGKLLRYGPDHLRYQVRGAPRLNQCLEFISPNDGEVGNNGIPKCAIEAAEEVNQCF